ncbi:MAG: lipocalin family protein [Bacteroidota bacterium]
MPTKALFLFSIILFIGCQSEPQYTEDQLLGQWNLTEWKDLTNDKAIDGTVQFIFEAESRYTGTYGKLKEVGKFWIEGDNLHTIEDGKAEKKVKIEKLNSDTLIFGMNRVGNLEQMILIKAN